MLVCKEPTPFNTNFHKLNNNFPPLLWTHWGKKYLGGGHVCMYLQCTVLPASLPTFTPLTFHWRAGWGLSFDWLFPIIRSCLFDNLSYVDTLQQCLCKIKKCTNKKLFMTLTFLRLVSILSYISTFLVNPYWPFCRKKFSALFWDKH